MSEPGERTELGDGADLQERVMVDLNEATEAELQELPGIGPGKRRALLKQHGSLRAVRAATQAELAAAGIELAFAELKGPVKDRLHRYGIYARIGDRFFYCNRRLVQAFKTKERVVDYRPDDGENDSKDDLPHGGSTPFDDYRARVRFAATSTR